MRDQKFLEDIAKRLKEVRKKRGLSQAQVSIDTGISVSRYEIARKNVTTMTLGVLCKYYGITLEEFFHGIEVHTAPWD